MRDIRRSLIKNSLNTAQRIGFGMNDFKPFLVGDIASRVYDKKQKNGEAYRWAIRNFGIKRYGN
jgi:hypothetical protein